MLYLLELQKLSVASMTLDDMLAVSAECKILKTEYESHKVPVPEGLTSKIEDLAREIGLKRRDYLAMRLKSALLKREGLKTRDERVADTDREIAELERQLNA